MNGGMALVAECVRRLEEGEDGERVMRTLRERYTTLNSLCTRACQVRCAYAGPLDADGQAAARELREACACDADRQSADVLIASYGRSRWNGSDALRDVVERTSRRLVPAHVRACDITPDEMRTVKRRRREVVSQRHESAPRVDLSKLLAHARGVVRDAAAHRHDLVLALLALTGRRTTELLNGRSTLEVCGAHACTFWGQLKTRGGTTAYVIPVLDDADVVVSAYDRLRKTLATDRSNRAVSQTHQSALGQRLHTHAAYGRNGVEKVHALRAVYAVAVFRLFDCSPRTMVATTRACLGHASSEEGLAYTALTLDVDDDEKSLGEFPG